MTRVIALGLTLLTGAAGLIYEVTWQRYVALLLGSDSEATAAVLGLFLGSLALGYALFGEWTRRRLASQRGTRLLAVYAGIEIAIGGLALLFPWTFSAVQTLSLWAPFGTGGLGFAIDVGLAALLIAPPTVLMGATIPILTQALAPRLEDATRIHAAVYALNTAGAVPGALLASFVLIPSLGLAGTLRGASALSIGSGVLLAALGAVHRTPPLASPSPGTATPPGFARYAAAATLVGFGMMALQTVAIRVGGLALGPSHLTFSLVVAAFILSIALGAAAVGAFPRIRTTALPFTQWLLFASSAGLYLLVDRAPYAGHVLRTLFDDTDASFYGFQSLAFGSIVAVVLIPAALSGAFLPLVFHSLRRQTGELGQLAGRIYAWNTFGSLTGALAGGHLLLFWLDLPGVYLGALLALLSAAVLVTAPGSRRRLTATWSGLAAFIAIVALPSWNPRHMTSGAYRARSPLPSTYLSASALYSEIFPEKLLVFHDDGPNTTVSVLEEGGERPSRTLVVNGKSDGDSQVDFVTMSLTGLLPALFAEQPERAFVIGYGLGVTAGELASLRSIREVAVAEISHAVLDAAPLFDFANGGAFTNPKIRIVRSDAYRALLRSSALYDVISSEPSNPWVAGVEMVYSREFLSAARERLTPGGVYAQWIHRYEMNRETLLLVLRSFASVFERVSVWYSLGQDLVLLGFNDADGSPDLERLKQRASQPDFAEALNRSGIDGLQALLAHELVPTGVITPERIPGKLHTLTHPRLSHAAAKAFFRGGRRVSLPLILTKPAIRDGTAGSLARRDLSAQARAARIRETCRTFVAPCMTLIAEWAYTEPEAKARVALLRELTRSPQVMAEFAQSRPAKLKPLFDSTGAQLPGEMSAAAADAWEQSYLAYFHYAAPFPAGVRREIWRRCAPQEDSRCIR